MKAPKPTDADYQAIHKNSGHDLIDIEAEFRSGRFSIKDVVKYIAVRTDVAYRRGWFSATKQQSLKGTEK
jgi:hypothetical protein